MVHHPSCKLPCLPQNHLQEHLVRSLFISHTSDCTHPHAHIAHCPTQRLSPSLHFTSAQGCTKMDDNRGRGTAPPPGPPSLPFPPSDTSLGTPPPSPWTPLHTHTHFIVGKTKPTTGKIDFGHFRRAIFWVLDPPPPASSLPMHACPWGSGGPGVHLLQRLHPRFCPSPPASLFSNSQHMPATVVVQ